MAEKWTETVDEKGETPVSRGLRSGHAPTVNLILTIAEPPQPQRDAPIHTAARNSRVEEVREQLELGAHINEPDAYGLTPLHWAAINGCLDLARLLVNRGAAVNAREDMMSNLTPLALARWMGYDELAEYLHEHGGML